MLEKKRENVFVSADSLYKTFPSISVADRYRYFDFKRELTENIRSSDRSYDTAIIYIDSMISVIEEKGLEKTLSKEYIKAFSIRCEYFTRLQRYSDAIRDAVKCKQLNANAGDSCLVAENTKTLSNIAIKQGNFPLAITLLKEALLLTENCIKNKEQFVRLQRYLDDMGFIYWNLKKYDSSEMYHLAAANYVLENKQLMGQDSVFVLSALENIYGNLGYLYFKIKNYAEAEKYVKKTMLLTRNPGLAKMQTLLGKIYLGTGKIDEAEEMAEKATGQLDYLEIEYKGDFFELQSNIANAKKQYEKALKYQELFRLAKDTINRRKMDLLKKNPFVEYEQLDKKYQVELLEKDNRNQQNRTKAVVAIGALVALLAVISFYFIWRLRVLIRKRSVLYKQLKRTMEEKETAEKLLRENELLTQEMQLQIKFNEAIIQQRSQISDDMHDELSSSLAALKFYVEDEKKKSAGTVSEKSLSDISEEVNAVYKNARSYMHSLKTNQWETRFNIVSFLNEIQKKFAEKELLVVQLSIDEENIKSKLSTFQHDQLYHICSEAITNIINHASGTIIKISIQFWENECIFLIEDNGSGFLINCNEAEGIGLKSMRKRVADLKGSLEVNTGTEGTSLKGSFPIF